MQWASAQSAEWNTEVAFAAMSDEVDAQMSDPTLVVVFCSRAHQTRFAQIPGLLRARFPTAVILGCSARGVVGGGVELEREPSASIVAAKMPSAKLTPFRIPESPGRINDAEWRSMIGSDPVSMMVFTDSFSCDSGRLLARLNEVYPGVPVFGGLASSASHPGSNALFQNDAFFREGGVGLAISGDVELQTLVAQGCRPVAEVQTVVRAERNIVIELDCGRPDAWVDALVEGLGGADRDLVPRSLFVGVRRDSEWLVRTIVGYDPNSGAMTLTERVNPGDQLRFFLRDARASREDLERQLSHVDPRVAGGFLFTCVGRGEGLYGEPGHDSRLVADTLGDVPVGGFFCAGEYGPVSGRNYVHGYTTTLALFRES